MAKDIKTNEETERRGVWYWILLIPSLLISCGIPLTCLIAYLIDEFEMRDFFKACFVAITVLTLLAVFSRQLSKKVWYKVIWVLTFAIGTAVFIVSYIQNKTRDKEPVKTVTAGAVVIDPVEYNTFNNYPEQESNTQNTEDKLTPNQGNVDGRHCTSQEDCGGKHSQYFCNYVRSIDYRATTPNICQPVHSNMILTNGNVYRYNTAKDLESWCREAREGAPEDTPGNCNWGYLSYEGANNWCTAVGGKLLSKSEMETIWPQFMRYDPPFGKNPCYWTTTDEGFGHWCYGEPGKGGNTRDDGYWGAGAVICKIE